MYGLDEAQQRRLADLAAAGKQRPWWQPYNLPYSTYVGLEWDATCIRDFGLGLVPGLLQTRDYARAVLRANVPHRPPDAIEQRLQGRAARQERVLASANPPEFRAVLEMSVLHRIVGGREVMRAQLQHLLDASDLPHITVQVVPYEAGALPGANNKFIILSFADLDLSDVVFVEGLTSDLYLQRDDEIETYNAAFSELEGLAASPEETRAIIASIISRS